MNGVTSNPTIVLVINCQQIIFCKTFPKNVISEMEEGGGGGGDEDEQRGGDEERQPPGTPPMLYRDVFEGAFMRMFFF